MGKIIWAGTAKNCKYIRVKINDINKLTLLNTFPLKRFEKETNSWLLPISIDIVSYLKKKGAHIAPNLEKWYKKHNNIRDINVIENVWLSIQDPPEEFTEEIIKQLTLINPLWMQNKIHNRWQGGTEKYIYCYEEDKKILKIPRGFLNDLKTIANQNSISINIEDMTRILPDVDIEFTGKLKDFQEEPVKDILKNDIGTLSSGTGTGKTVMALKVIAERKQPTLVIVHTKELLYQWRTRIEEFTNIRRSKIGLIGNGHKKLGDQVTVGIVNSIYTHGTQISKSIGQVICDEAHRCPSNLYIKAIIQFDAKYRLGLSATTYRRDKLDKLIYWYVGPIVHTVDTKKRQDKGDILKVDVTYRYTDFDTDMDVAENYARVLSDLTQDENRNKLIVKDILTEVKKKTGTILVLSDRKKHCYELYNMLYQKNINCKILTGETKKKEREEIVKKVNSGEIDVLIATGQLIGEGFDCKGLSILFLTTPIKFHGRLIQYLGRILRPGPGKERAQVYDYVNGNIGVFIGSQKSRARVYAKMK